MNNWIIHLAITYLDIILSVIEVSKSDYKPYAMCCLSIASKFDELDPNIPLSREFIKYGNLRIKSQEFIHNEAKIIQKYLKWDLNILTVYHFAEWFLTMGIVFSNDQIKGKSVSQTQLVYMYKRVMFFVDLSTEWNKLRSVESAAKFTPSVIALSCVIWARRMSKFDIIWNQWLSELSGYSDPFNTNNNCKGNLFVTLNL